MNAALRRATPTWCWIMAAALVAALALVGCGDDDDDYTATSQNCQVTDYGGGEQYTLCCTLTCHYHYDHDEYVEQCQEDRTCSTPTGSACPDWVIEGHDYPHCYY